jgi:hypothetical protein
MGYSGLLTSKNAHCSSFLAPLERIARSIPPSCRRRRLCAEGTEVSTVGACSRLTGP